ncbi:MAG: hypothetical protein K8T25_16710 [Planctomycetia bacterium]|nr:hypothetical protein [Planctomycetia bacterium]
MPFNGEQNGEQIESPARRSRVPVARCCWPKGSDRSGMLRSSEWASTTSATA